MYMAFCGYLGHTNYYFVMAFLFQYKTEVRRMAYRQTTLFRYMKPAELAVECEPRVSVPETPNTESNEVSVETKTVGQGTPYPDIGRLETTELGRDDLKYKLVTESWDSSKYKFPSRFDLDLIIIY